MQAIFTTLSTRDAECLVIGGYGDLQANDPIALYPTKTELENTYINSATQLSVARTIIHETIHAYFQYGLNNLQGDPNFSNFQIINSVLFGPLGNTLTGRGVAQHNQMALDYVTGIGQMLETYANNNNIACPDPNRTLSDYCKDLAWVGLLTTDAYLNLPVADRIRINNIGLNEQNNLPGATQKKACP